MFGNYRFIAIYGDSRFASPEHNSSESAFTAAEQYAAAHPSVKSMEIVEVVSRGEMGKINWRP